MVLLGNNKRKQDAQEPNVPMPKYTPPKHKGPLKIRKNLLSRPLPFLQKLFAKKEDGKRIRLNPEQVKEAQSLMESQEDIILNISGSNFESIPEPKTIEPILLLMKNNGYTDVLENVKPGEFIMTSSKGEKSIVLQPSRMTTFKFGNTFYRGWIAYEDCATPYPEDPLYSSSLFRQIIQKIAINYQSLNEAALWTAKGKFWLYVIGGIALALVLIFSTDFGKELMMSAGNAISNIGAKEVAQQAVEQVKQNITQTVNTGVTVQ